MASWSHGCVVPPVPGVAAGVVCGVACVLDDALEALELLAVASEVDGGSHRLTQPVAEDAVAVGVAENVADVPVAAGVAEAEGVAVAALPFDGSGSACAGSVLTA